MKSSELGTYDVVISGESGNVIIAGNSGAHSLAVPSPNDRITVDGATRMTTDSDTRTTY